MNMKAIHYNKIAGSVFDERLLEESLVMFMDFVNELLKSTTDECSQLEQMAVHVIDVLDREIEAKEGHSLLASVSRKDSDTFIHSLNVAMLCYDIAKWNGFSKEEREEAALCGLLHDVGKLSVPDHVLLKPGHLTVEEREIIKKHTLQGYFNLWSFTNENLKLTAVQHHERYDGSGYPFGLRGDDINRYAQICSIADVYDAMTSERVYHKARRPEVVLEIMERDSAEYSPVYFPVFASKVREILNISKAHLKVLSGSSVSDTGCGSE